LPDLLRPPDSENGSPTLAHGAEPPQPSEVEVVHALVEVEHATASAPALGDPATPNVASTPQAGPSRTAGAILYLTVGFALIILLGWTMQHAARRIQWWAATSTSNWTNGNARHRKVTQRTSSASQADAERLLERIAAGDAAAIDQVLLESDDWIGKTQRTPKANQLIMATLNQHDLHARGAALQATLAMDGVARNEAGLNRLELAVANPNQRGWALWMFGALGNRGVEQERIVQILKGYLDDPNAPTRSGAVDSLGIVASDETVSILLDRFRNDPSPAVQESAARNLGEAGMYTHEQQILAAANLVGCVEDAQLTPPQREWAAHALRDISGQNFGPNATAWQQWYNGTH
jgi:HEAT repeats